MGFAVVAALMLVSSPFSCGFLVQLKRLIPPQAHIMLALALDLAVRASAT
jgi:hypothetical protein